MWIVLPVALSLLLVLPQAPAVSGAAAPPTSNSKIWIGRYAEFEDFLRTAPFERFEETTVGVTRPRHGFFATGGLAAGATVKNLPPRRQHGFFESYKSEIAAYKLDKLLQLEMVPPTVERPVDGEVMSIQLWVENTRTIKHVQEQRLHSPDPIAWNRDVYRQRVFDNLVANIDENAGNLLIDLAWRIIKVDHSRCFVQDKMPFDLTRIDRALFERIQALDHATLTREIGDYMEPGTIDSLLRRRDQMVRKFQQLIAKKGEAQVLIP
jgi:hypothetical protein